MLSFLRIKFLSTCSRSTSATISFSCLLRCLPGCAATSATSVPMLVTILPSAQVRPDQALQTFPPRRLPGLRPLCRHAQFTFPCSAGVLKFSKNLGIPQTGSFPTHISESSQCLGVSELIAMESFSISHTISSQPSSRSSQILYLFGDSRNGDMYNFPYRMNCLPTLTVVLLCIVARARFPCKGTPPNRRDKTQVFHCSRF